MDFPLVALFGVADCFAFTLGLVATVFLEVFLALVVRAVVAFAVLLADRFVVVFLLLTALEAVLTFLPADDAALAVAGFLAAVFLAVAFLAADGRVVLAFLVEALEATDFAEVAFLEAVFLLTAVLLPAALALVDCRLAAVRFAVAGVTFFFAVAELLAVVVLAAEDEADFRAVFLAWAAVAPALVLTVRVVLLAAAEDLLERLVLRPLA